MTTGRTDRPEAVFATRSNLRPMFCDERSCSCLVGLVESESCKHHVQGEVSITGNVEGLGGAGKLDQMTQGMSETKNRSGSPKSTLCP
jgi:hypothetical protein